MDGEPLVLIGVAAWCFGVALAGGLVGLVLGNIRLPAILLLATTPAAGAGANIGISAVAAATASLAHARAGRVNWRLFAWMAPPSALGAAAGGLVSGEIPDTALLLAIATLLVAFGIDLLRPRPAGAGSTERSAGEPELHIRAAVVSGGAIGLLGGFAGLILGSLRMPALLRWVGESPAAAVGTNVTVGFCVGVAGVIGHVPSGVDWDLLAVGSAASIPGALIGSRLTGRLSERQLLRAIGAVLIVAGIGAAASALT